jgi:uncharacterized membrane protein YccC
MGSNLPGTLAALIGFAVGGLITTSLLLSPWPRRVSHQELAPSTPSVQQGANGTRQPLLAPLLAQWTFHTPISLFSLINTVGATLAAGISWGFAFPYPQWTPTTEILNARPDPRVTFGVTIQRLIGTVLGAIIASFLILTLEKTVVFLLIIAVALLIGFAVKDINAGLSIFFLTMSLLLLISFSYPEDLSYAVFRVLETLIGVGIAFLVGGVSMWIFTRHKK